jgi:hypothetical protein
MKALKVFLVAAVAILAVTGIGSVWPQVAWAQGDAFGGTWILNVAKSKYAPGPAPKTQTVVYETTKDGVKVTSKGTDAAGNPTLTSYAATYDGKDVPVTGNPDYDTISVKRVDPQTLQFTRKRAGKVVQTGTSVVSKDGKTRTVTAVGVNAKGQKINNVTVFEKK